MKHNSPRDFCALKTLFSDSSSRNLDNISRIYADPEFLIDEISSLVNPYLQDYMVRGKRVLFKPNWVMHPVTSLDYVCLCTNKSFLLAAVEVILRKSPHSVVIGDAPIQLCDWEKLLSSDFYESINKLRIKYEVEISIHDFRRTKFEASSQGVICDAQPLDQYVFFDLGSDSLLEHITSVRHKTPFRVTNYNPDILSKAHRKGVHRYCIAKQLFDADIVISIPKIKTHQKTGITGALKNLVGLNGDKDFLPHHRLGGTGFGGDCYPGRNFLRLFSELALDISNKSSFAILRKLWAYISKLVWILSFPNNAHSLSAGWYGNDTTWRMVMDLNKIALFGRVDGTISATRRRSIYSLCDGIVAGQGDGPLSPEPLALGFMAFSNNSTITDACFGTLIGLDIYRVPLLKAALTHLNLESLDLTLNNYRIAIPDLKKFAISATLPVGWKNYRG